MTQEQKLLLDILNSSINDFEANFDFNNINWEFLLNECINHSVVLHCYDKLSSNNHIIPENVYNNLKNISYNVLLRNSLINSYQNEVTDIFDKNNISYVVIKGEASSSFYNNPELRVLGDVDLLIKENDRDFVDSVLKENGYTSLMEGHKCHTVYKRGKAHIEVHFKPSGLPDLNSDDIILEFLKEVTQNFAVVNKETNSFKIPNNCHHALILLLHMQHHLTGDGLGLRHIVDWASFVKATYNEPFWSYELIPFLKKIGLMEFTFIISEICRKHLGVPIPFDYKGDETTVELILEDILSGGNFGSKDKTRSESSMMISSVYDNKLKNLFHVFKNSVYEQHKTVREHKFLYPVFFIYRFFRYFTLVIFKKRNIFIKSMPQAEDRIKLYKRLHLFEVNVND